MPLAAKFAGMVAAFCERVGWTSMGTLVSHFQARITHGVRQELLGLAEIDCIKGARARQLFREGIKTVEDVAACDVDEMVEVLGRAPSGRGRGTKEGQQDERERARVLRKNAQRAIEVGACLLLRCLVLQHIKMEVATDHNRGGMTV